MKVRTVILVTDDLGHTIEQVVDIEDMTREEWDANKSDAAEFPVLSIADTGSEPGQPYRVELWDEDSDEVLDSYDTTAV